jgi:hypothetical protein
MVINEVELSQKKASSIWLFWIIIVGFNCVAMYFLRFLLGLVWAFAGDSIQMGFHMITLLPLSLTVLSLGFLIAKKRETALMVAGSTTPLVLVCLFILGLVLFRSMKNGL